MKEMFEEVTIDEATLNLQISSEGPVGGCGIGCNNY